MAMAMEKSARSQPKSLAMGSWNTPKLARMPKFRIKMNEAAIRTGVKRGDLVNFTLRSWEADAGRSGGNGQINNGDGGYAFWERVAGCGAFGLRMATALLALPESKQRGGYAGLVAGISDLSGLSTVVSGHGRQWDW